MGKGRSIPKKRGATVHQHGAHKTVKIKPHHAKPYRKRHYLSLAVVVMAGLLLLAFVWQYSVRRYDAVSSARDYLHTVFGSASSNGQLVRIDSSNGFSVQYDQNKYYAGAVDSSTGSLFLGDQLTTRRAYTAVRVSPVGVVDRAGQSSLSLAYYPNKSVDAKLANVEAAVTAPSLGIDAAKLVKAKSQLVELAGRPFLKTVWQVKIAPILGTKVSANYVTYTGNLQGKPFVITITNNLLNATTDWYQPIVASLRFNQPARASSAAVTQTKLLPLAALAKLDTFFQAGLAKAALPTPSTAERVSALYTPAVVKIYNVYCMDIALEGHPYLKNACNGESGSGFFVSGSGYIATNGHVATSNPKDIVIYDAFLQYQKGNDKYLKLLVQLSGLKQSDVAGLKADDALKVIVDKLYDGIPDGDFTVTNSVRNLLVCLNSKQPDVTELLQLTKNRQPYATQDSIKQAKLVAANYRMIDPDFQASDVALVKIDGSNYPVTKLGTIDAISTGQNINIFGFPGEASDNSVVSNTASTVTLTTGTVSSIKNDKGGKHKLIETATTIGHGNSGGPAIDDDGAVVGIATYTVDGAGQGNGTYNYIRDIKDLKDLAQANNIQIGGSDKTQQEWEKAIGLFYRAHYSEAMKHFDAVKQLYPQSPTVAELITQAKQHIANGDDVKDFPIVPVVIVAVVVLAAGAGVVVMMLRHRQAHNVYKAHVASGTMQPLAPGAPAQTVAYNPAVVQAVNNPALYPQPQPMAVATPTATTPTVTPTTAAGVPQPAVIVPIQVQSDGQPQPTAQPPLPPQPPLAQ